MYNLRNSGTQYVGKMSRRFQSFSLCFGNTSAKETAEASAETVLYYAGNGFGTGRNFAKGYDSFFDSWDYLFYLNYIVYS